MIPLSKLLIILAVSYSSARFGNENECVGATKAIQGAPPGVVETFAGQSIASLLAKADPCEKLKWADKIIDQLGSLPGALEAAICFVNAEKNYNNFAQNLVAFCNDPSLPVSTDIRGILPIISEEGPFEAPGTSGVPIRFGAQGTLTAIEFNKLAEITVRQPLAQTEGKSIAMLAVELGFMDMIDFEKVSQLVDANCSGNQSPTKDTTIAPHIHIA
ncbi:hypothetical protein NEOLI_001998 [Neolecta irregularis DAH-3]|uniref:Uncharacterized protein n=1 Tax=Neolecta irregularis (strain DAH-3) TaxID=1198029 RepID=A0A1U7LH25_NEOID|nr:hypothetical protein NEOLI_001998 [Neolecta irregularis DAH-3]|eukprot:OLL21928.1 hypothetical protein NEOLI_001998 [Neolecta irregularis DAH-3]